MFDQSAKYMDHYEQGLYNHILASVAEDDPGNTYHVPLNPGAQKRFGNADMSGFTCCNGTALESNTKLQDSIYFRSADDKTLYVNLFVPSTLNWTERKVVVTQQTDFPYADTTKLTLEGGGAFDIKIRVPQWAAKGIFVKINGRDQAVKAVSGQLPHVAPDVADERHHRAAHPVPLLPGVRGRPAQRRQHLLRPGAPRRRGIRTPHRLAPGDARRAPTSRSRSPAIPQRSGSPSTASS